MVARMLLIDREENAELSTSEVILTLHGSSYSLSRTRGLHRLPAKRDDANPMSVILGANFLSPPKWFRKLLFTVKSERVD